MNFNLPHNCRVPGVKTNIQQLIDVPSLSPAQFTRLKNCAERGFVLGSGYVSSILGALAERHYLMAPVLARRAYSTMVVEHEVFNPESPVYDREIVADIMNLSDVRYKFQISQNPKAGRYQDAKSTSQEGSLNLVGWADASPDVLRKEILARLTRIPHFVESTKQLAAIVAERPLVEVYSRTY